MPKRTSTDLSTRTGTNGWTQDRTPAPRGRNLGSLRQQLAPLFNPQSVTALLLAFTPFMVLEAFNQSRETHAAGVWNDALPYTIRLLVLVGFSTWAAVAICRTPKGRPAWHTAAWAATLSLITWAAAASLAVPIAQWFLLALMMLGFLLVVTLLLAFIPGGSYLIAGLWWLVGWCFYGTFWLLTWPVRRLMTPPEASRTSGRAPTYASRETATPSAATEPEPEHVDRWANWAPFGGQPPRSRAQDAAGGEIWWAELPFEDNPLDAKDRPVLVVENTGTELVVAKITSKDKSERPDFIKVPDGTDGLGDTCGYLSLKTTIISYDEIRRYGGNPGPKFLIRYNRARAAFEEQAAKCGAKRKDQGTGGPRATPADAPIG